MMWHQAQVVLPYLLILISFPLIWQSIKALDTKDNYEKQLQTHRGSLEDYETEQFDDAISLQQLRFWLYGLLATASLLGGASMLLF